MTGLKTVVNKTGKMTKFQNYYLYFLEGFYRSYSDVVELNVHQETSNFTSCTKRVVKLFMLSDVHYKNDACKIYYKIVNSTSYKSVWQILTKLKQLHLTLLNTE